jgi:branched-chain amino acid transport system ATP-binding protein
MLSIGRAFINNNRLILIDEPSKGLAPIMVEKLAKALIKVKEHTTIILVEQNFKFASMVGDRYYILDDGKTVLQGEMPDLVKDTEIQERFLGIMLKGRD